MGQSKDAKELIICGAGIGGLTAAIAVARQGFSVRILEKSTELAEVGAGIQLSPNAVHVLKALDLEAKIREVAFEPESSVIRDYASGKVLVDVPLKQLCQKRYGARYLHIHRADLHSILADAALNAGAKIELGQTVKEITQADQQVHIQTQDTLHSGDVVIGADGLRSVVRDAILGPEPPAFTGQVAWRGTVSVDSLPKDLIPPKATVWVGPHHHFVTYYIKSGRLVNFVAVQERADWTKTGWSENGDIAELRAAFSDWHPDISTLLDATQKCFLWALFDREPLPVLVDRRAALLGDAAHPMLPFMAQGAAMAIEDAWVLADMLSKFSTLLALQKYEAVRKPRITMIQQMSRANARLFHRRDGPADIWPRTKLKLAGYFPKAARFQLDKVYGTNVTG